MCWRHFLPGVASLPEALKRSGHWRVEAAGKIWHSRNNVKVNPQEFDRVFGSDGDHSDFYGHPTPLCDGVDSGTRVAFVPDSNMKVFGTCGGVMADQKVVDWARGRLRKHAATTTTTTSSGISSSNDSDKKKSLALFVGLKQTHLPWYSPASSLSSARTA